MKRLLTALAVLFVLALTVGLSLWLGRPSAGPGGIEPPSAVAADGPSRDALVGSTDPDAELAATETVAPDDAPQRTVASLESTPDAPHDEAPAAHRALTGEVVAPPELAQELARLRIVATDRRTGVNGVLDLLEDPVRSAFTARHPRMIGLGFDDLDDQGESVDTEIVAEARVDARGEFELEVPESGSSVHLTVIGPRAYTWTSREVRADEAGPIRLYPELGAIIEGRLRTVDGETPAEGAMIELTSTVVAFNGVPTSQRQSRRVAEVGADGRFRFEGLTTETGYRLDVYPEDAPTVRREVPAPRPGEVVKVEVVLPRGARLEGRVVDAAGEPVPNARVFVESSGQMFGFDTRVLARGEADDAGNFVLTSMPIEKVSVRARAEGLLESKSEKLQLESGELRKDLELVLEEGGVVAGTITWEDGAPAVGVEVLATFESSKLNGMTAFRALRGFGSRARSDETGAFRITGLGKGPFSVWAREQPAAVGAAAVGAAGEEEGAEASGPLFAARRSNVLPGTGTAPKEVDLVLRRLPGLAGRVVDTAGEPVTAFEVRIGRLEESEMGEIAVERQSQAVESEAGAFTFAEAGPGTYRVQLSAPGFVAAVVEGVEVPQSDEAPLVVTLQEGGHVVGVVRDPFGTPVTDAEVTLGGSGASWTRELRGEAETPRTRTDASGRFALTELSLEEELSLIAEKRGFAKSETASVRATPERDEAQDVVLVLRTGGRITGEVYDATGTPAAGRAIQALNAETWESHSATADADGTFSFEHLVPGAWTVTSMASGMNEAMDSADVFEGDGLAEWMSETKTASADVVDGEEAHVVLGAPPSDPVEVHGRVSHAGEPYTGALVTYLARKQGVAPAITQVDDKGEYSLTLDSPGEYVSFVQKLTGRVGEQETIEFTVTVPEGDRHREDFEIPTARITGEVRGPDGAPADGVRISLRSKGGIDTSSVLGGQFAEGRTDEDGRYDLRGLRPGRYVLSAGGMQTAGLFGSDAETSREIAHDVELGEGQWLEDVDFRLREPGEIEVSVSDGEGRPVEGATLFVRDASGVLLDRFSFLATGSNGKVGCGGLSPGRYTVLVRKGTRVSAESANVQVESGAKASVAVEIEEGTQLAISIRDDERNALRATITVVDDDGRQWNGMMAYSDLIEMFTQGLPTDERRVGPLPPGRYKVTVVTPDGKQAKKRVNVRSGQDVRRFTLWPKP